MALLNGAKANHVKCPDCPPSTHTVDTLRDTIEVETPLTKLYLAQYQKSQIDSLDNATKYKQALKKEVSHCGAWRKFCVIAWGLLAAIVGIGVVEIYMKSKKAI